MDWHELAEQLLAIQLPDLPDNLPGPERTSAALSMMELGCSDEQIADQLRFKVKGSTLKGLRKLHGATAR